MGNRDLWPLAKVMDRFFEEPLQSRWLTTDKFHPNCEITEDKEHYTAKFEMPGIPKDQIKIELNDNVLTVSGERKEEKREDSKKRHYSEFSYGSFYRSFSLPTPVNPEKVSASYDGGVLTINLTKADGGRARQITVK